MDESLAKHIPGFISVQIKSPLAGGSGARGAGLVAAAAVSCRHIASAAFAGASTAMIAFVTFMVLFTFVVAVAAIVFVTFVMPIARIRFLARIHFTAVIAAVIVTAQDGRV